MQIVYIERLHRLFREDIRGTQLIRKIRPDENFPQTKSPASKEAGLFVIQGIKNLNQIIEDLTQFCNI
jgi:hypothetical protein